MKRSVACLTVMTAAVAMALATLAQASTYNVIYRFQGGTDGSSPYAGLIADSAGNLYGTTEFGGSARYGTVFKLTPGTGGAWTETVLYNFTLGADGGEPQADVVMDSAGNLYGTTASGGDPTCVAEHGYCGVIFKLTPGAGGIWTESVLLDFTGTNGLEPVGGLIFDSAGNLYGTTYFGGTLGYGTVFELSPSSGGTWTQTVLANMPSQIRSPNSDLVFDAAGNLYGTTSFGGSSTSVCIAGCGTIFKLTPGTGGTWTVHAIHSFNGTNGATPVGLAIDAAGNLFGSAPFGGTGACPGLGANGCGVVYELAPQTGGAWRESLTHDFRTIAANTPNPVSIDGSGNIYGTTIFGGNMSLCSGQGCGTIYRLAPVGGRGWTFTGLYAFGQGANGFYPYKNLTIDHSGNIYGVTGAGGDLSCGSTGGCGVVFQIIP